MHPSRLALRIPAATALLVLAACQAEFPVGSLQRARETADHERLTVDLDRIAAWHLDNGTGVEPRLRPPVDDNALRTAFAGLPITPTRELRALWTWRDGTDDGPQPLIWYHDFLPLDRALAEYHGLLRHPMIAWDPRFVPIFTFEGEYYAAYCGSEEIEAGPIVLHVLEDGPSTAYASLTAMLATAADAMTEGAVTWNPETGGIAEDLPALALVHARHNPGVPFPYAVPE